MTRTPMAVFEFLDWIVGIGRERGYEASRRADLLVDEPRLVSRTRYTVDQGLNTPSWDRSGDVHFKVNDEVKARVDGIDQLYSVVLDVHSKRTWNPDRDDFYPLSVSYLRRQSNEDINGDYPIRLDLTDPYFQSRRNDLDRLFPVKQPSEDGAIGSDGGSGGPDGFGGDGEVRGEPYRVGTTANLRRIAEAVYQ